MDFFDQKLWLFNATINDDDIGYLLTKTIITTLSKGLIPYN